VKVVTVQQMRDIEKQAAEMGVSWEILMENAGLAVAREVESWVGSVAGRPILVLVGPGNNGGDGLVAARHLHDWGADVHLFLLKPRPESDRNFQLVRQRDMHIMVAGEPGSMADLEGLVPSLDIAIDALFGTGRARPLEGDAQYVLARLREAKAKNSALQIVALDLPSGLDADTGAVDSACLPADLTVTLGYPKHGLYLFPGAATLGKLVVAGIGIPPRLAEDVVTETVTPEGVRPLLPQRPPDANKGTFGRVMVAGGSVNYIGAVYLACTAAIRVGAGLVTLATARSLQPVLASKLTEVTYAPLPEAEPGIVAADAAETLRSQLADYSVLLLGCGLGRTPSATQFVQSTLFSTPDLPALVIDADGLNILATIPQWWERLAPDAVLTPHPGEMSRLTGLSVQEIQSNRMQVAAEAAARWHKTVILKGAYTLVAAPDGRVRVNPSANPGLASAGTGDVLAGAIAGLAAQGLSPFDAAVAGVFLHGQAGEVVRRQIGDAGMIASDLLDVLPVIIKRIKEGGSGLESVGS